MFAHPTSANIAWRDIESLLSALVGLTRGKVMGLMTVDGYKARIEYDAETDSFRGEILGLNGGADFHGRTPRELRQEFRRSLAVFLEVCREKGIEPRRSYSGKFNLRIPPVLHERLSLAAQAADKSINAFAQEALEMRIAERR